MEIEDPSEEMVGSHDVEKFVKDEDKRIGESPVKHEDNGEKVESAANQEDDKEKAESPTEKEDNKKSGSPTETSNTAESSKRKRLVKGKGKVTKKSPVTNSLTTAKAVEQDAEKEVNNPNVEMFESNEGVKFTKDEDKRNVELPSEHEDNGEKVESAANQEDDKEKAESPTEKEDNKKSGSPTETSNTAESSKRKSLVKGKGKVAKKSPVTNYMTTIKAVEQDVEKEVNNPNVDMFESNEGVKFTKEEDKRNGESASEHEDNGEKVESAANQEDNEEKVKSPSEKEDIMKKSGSTTETTNNAESSKRERLVKGKGKVTKKSPVTNIKAVEQDAKKEVENAIINMQGNVVEKFTKDEDNRNEESPSKHKDNGEKVLTAASQVKSPTKREDTKTCNLAESSKRRRLVKGKGKVEKKSPATNSLNTIKVIEQDAKKEVENPTVVMLESNEGEKFTKDEDMRNGKSPRKPEDSGEKVEFTAKHMKKFGGHTETYNKAESSKTKRHLRAKGQIMKRTPAVNSLSAIKAEGSPMVQGKQRMGKGRKETAAQGKIKSRSNEEEATNLSSRDDKKKTNTEEEPIQDSKVAHADIEMIAELQKGPKEVKNEQKSGASDAKKEKRKEKIVGEEKSELNKNKKEKLGGLIFMCSAKTKPDCFRYKIMGVSIGKKDIVLAIKPGLKLFLYDFDLKLLYGVYRASSNGGMKLEPKAFRGAFPAQVRFKVHKDCFPLPETVFKKAIKENYYAKNKFKTELTFKQVKKLTELYRSAEFRSRHSSKRRIHSPPRIHGREVHARSRDLEYEDSFANGNSKSYHLLHRERERAIVRRELSPIRREEIPRERAIVRRELSPIRREEIPRDLYLSEKDYRSFGLRGERQNLDPSSRDRYETLPRDYDREPIPRNPEYRRIDPLYLEEKEHLAYSLRSDLASSSLSRGVRSPRSNNPYLVHRRDVPPLDPYLPPPRREDPELTYSRDGRGYMTEDSRRIDIDPVHRLYSTYASDPLPQAYDFHEARRETSTMPVSSRYSFAGPSLSYR